MLIYTHWCIFSSSEWIVREKSPTCGQNGSEAHAWWQANDFWGCLEFSYFSQEYVDKCRIRFSNDIKAGKIELVNQNSASALDFILKNNNDIDVVFLDAHFHGEGQEFAPLDQEIEILKNEVLKRKNVHQHKNDRPSFQ